MFVDLRDVRVAMRATAQRRAHGLSGSTGAGAASSTFAQLLQALLQSQLPPTRLVGRRKAWGTR